MNSPVLSKQAFGKIQQLVKEEFGLNLSEQKKSLVLARLQKLLKENSFTDFDSYLSFLLKDNTGRALIDFINKLTTNHTYFNRESQHFEFLRKIVFPQWLPNLKQSGNNKKYRIWSAGCASGEEPYQLVMELIEFFGYTLARERIAVLATDISTEALMQARQGMYSRENVLNLPATYVRKYFLPKTPDHMLIKPGLKEFILFKRFNLIRNHYPFKNRFHVILCRNVMIYFDQDTKDRLLEKFYQFLEPGGYLLIGHSESLMQRNKWFKYIQPSVYQKELIIE